MFLSAYTKALKRYDKDLFAKHNQDGIICVFRKHKRFEPVCETDGFKLLNLKEDKQFVCAITENWTLKTPPRVWGIDFVLEKIRHMDLQVNERMLDDLEAQNERAEESAKRSFKNETEAFFADNRKEFIKGIDEICGTTHSLSKDEPRKRLKDRSIKNGNY